MSVDFSSWYSLLLGGLLLLGLGFTLKAVKKRLYAHSFKRFCLVALANVVCVLVLLAWLGKLTITTQVSEHLTLLTPGTKGDIPDPGVFLQQNPGLSELDIKGYGLTAAQLKDFDGIKVRFDVPEISQGPVEVAWPKHLFVGESLVVTGRWHMRDYNQIVTVKLIDPAGSEVDSARVRKGELFRLTTQPKAQGHYFYQLQGVDSNGQIIADEPVSVFIGQSPKVKLLVMQSAPSFETRHLKNWATENGASMLLLSTISKERYLTQSVNLEQGHDKTFSAANLNDFDLLIVDGRALTQLPVQKLSLIEQASKNGLGVMIFASQSMVSQLKDMTLLNGFELKAKGPQADTRLNMANSDVLFNSLPYTLAASQGKSFEVGAKGQVLGMYRALGLGKVGVSILLERYRWRLNGQMQQYSRHWQSIMKSLARVSSDSRFLPVDAQLLSFPGQQLQVCILSDQGDKTLFWQDQKVALNQDQFNRFRYCTHVWPTVSGAQQFELKSAEDQLLDRLVLQTYAATHWQSAFAAQKVAAGKAFVAGQQQKLSGQMRKPTLNVPVDATWYWLLLVLFASILWWERKWAVHDE